MQHSPACYLNASTYHALALLAEEQENYTEARSNFQKALEIYVEYKDEYSAAIVGNILEPYQSDKIFDFEPQMDADGRR